MSARRLPVRPNLDQLRHQAKELLRAIRSGEADALADLAAFHPERIAPDAAKLADAQLVLARSYQASSWTRLVQACELIDAIWRDDIAAVQAMIRKHPGLLLEIPGRPRNPDDALGGPAYTLSVSATALAFEVGARAVDENGRRLAPADLPLETDSRHPEKKHAILAMYAEHGLVYPDTAPMALHRGRLDLLEQHLERDPSLLTRQFSYEEIFPPEIGCHPDPLATHGTPLQGATLLHICVDYHEIEIAQWLLARGMPVDARAAVDGDGFGGHTALFATVVSQPNFWMNYERGWELLGYRKVAPFTELLLAHGAEPNIRVSLRKQLHEGYKGKGMIEYPDVTPLSWGRRFEQQIFVSEPAMALIEAAGGRE